MGPRGGAENAYLYKRAADIPPKEGPTQYTCKEQCYYWQLPKRLNEDIFPTIPRRNLCHIILQHLPPRCIKFQLEKTNVPDARQRLTQWFFQFPLMTEEPKVLAGFMLAPVKFTVARWPRPTAMPMAKALMALASGLLVSQTPKTVNTSTKPRKNSIPNPCSSVSSGCTVVTPTFSFASGRRDWKWTHAIPWVGLGESSIDYYIIEYSKHHFNDLNWSLLVKHLVVSWLYCLTNKGFVKQYNQELCIFSIPNSLENYVQTLCNLKKVLQNLHSY